MYKLHLCPPVIGPMLINKPVVKCLEWHDAKADSGEVQLVVVI